MKELLQENILAVDGVSGEGQLQYFCYEKMCKVDKGSLQ